LSKIILYESSFSSVSKGKKYINFDELILAENENQILPENTFHTNTWLVNTNILQYSTITSWSGNSTSLKIESLVFTKLNVQEIDINCAVKIANQSVLFVPATERIYMESETFTLYKIDCYLNEDKFQVEGLDQIFVGIVNLNDYNQTNIDEVFFHKPKFFDLQQPKKFNPVNCVHTVRNMDKGRFEDAKIWLRLHQTIGYEKIRFYVLDHDNEYYSMLMTEFPDFLEIINHETNISRICKNLRLKNQPECIDRFKAYLDLETLFSLQEKVCTNDCFMSHKYSFKYLTNHDLDEVIFPRRFNTSFASKNFLLNCKRVNRKFKTFKMRDYIQKLVDFYGQDISYFRFENFLVHNEYNYMRDLIWKTNSTPNSIMAYMNQNAKSHLLFKINSQADLEHLNRLKQSAEFTKCTEKNYLNPSLMRSKWTHCSVSLFNNRYGKSIYVTELVKSINVHMAAHTSYKSNFQVVPVELGFVSHFRDVDHETTAMVQFIDKLKLDLEYLIFLTQNVKSILK
jgi:hypothetical protein